jgi:ABC-type polysaccharide/polyol phosphate transport system ATPase subunit
MTPALELQDVGVHFRATDLRHRTLKQVLAGLFAVRPASAAALDGVSLVVPVGQRVGVIGRNGAGKSTLIRVLAEIVLPNQGRVRTRGRVVPLLELGVGFHPELSGRENCYLVGSLLGFPPREIRKRLPRIVEFADIGAYLDSAVKYYSSGMYARLAFALATEVEPDILLLDEILGVGDAFFQEKSRQRLEHLMARGLTTVIVSHDLDFLLSHCDRLIWLERGKIARDGDCAEVAAAYRRQHDPAATAPP